MYERRRTIVIVIFTLCLIAALTVTFGSFLSKAKEKEADLVYYKYYTSVEIQPGDTLWDLADEYLEHYESKASYIKEVCRLNSLPGGDKIVSGESLILPYYSTEYKL